MSEIQLKEGQLQALNILETWFKDKDKDNYVATLKGFAGTGKTFLTQFFIKEMGVRNPLVSAPTNKAKTVIQEMTGFKGKTVHSILGLRPDTDLSNFNPLNPIFNPKMPPDVKYPLIIIDEASMVNTKLYNHLKDLASEQRVKMLFMGDPYQLAPVKERISKVFVEPKYQAELTEIVRQDSTNPSTNLIECAINDIKNNTNRLDDFLYNTCQDIDPNNLENSEGYVYTTKSNYNFGDYVVADKQNLLDNNSKYFAFTNNNIEGTLKSLRKGVFKFDSFIDPQDTLVGYRSIQAPGRGNGNIIVNSEEYRIIDLKKVTLSDGMSGYQILTENLYTKAMNWINLVDSSDEETVKIYSTIVNELISKAKAFGKGYWKNYYKFVDTNLAMINVYSPSGQKTKDKDIDFSYGYTVHKSQGSTFTNSFINFTNINRHFIPEDVRRLKYVAISRAKKVNIIM
jgi:ATP-dependent exoDNAse (exonuclease V) alpha subunit